MSDEVKAAMDIYRDDVENDSTYEAPPYVKGYLREMMGVQAEMSDEEYRETIRRNYRSSSTEEDLRVALEEWKTVHVPCGLEFGAFIRGPVPMGFWAKLWNRIGYWLIRKAGYKQIYP